MVKEMNRRAFLVTAGSAAAASIAGCINTDDSNGSPSPDTPTETDQTPSPETEMPKEYEPETPETTPSPDEPTSTDYLRERSPAIADMLRSYNAKAHAQIARSTNATANSWFDFNEDVLRGSKQNPMHISVDRDTETIADRYIADITIETDRFGPYADINTYIHEGRHEEDDVRNEISHILGYFIAETLVGNKTSLGNLVEPRINDRQDGVSKIDYHLQGANGGTVHVSLGGEDLSYASDKVYSTSSYDSYERVYDLTEGLMKFQQT